MRSLLIEFQVFDDGVGIGLDVAMGNPHGTRPGCGARGEHQGRILVEIETCGRCRPVRWAGLVENIVEDQRQPVGEGLTEFTLLAFFEKYRFAPDELGIPVQVFDGDQGARRGLLPRRF